MLSVSALRTSRLARIGRYLIPLLTFILGVLAQQQLQEYLQGQGTVNLAPLVLTIAVGILAIAIGILTHTSSTDIRSLIEAIGDQSSSTESLLSSVRDSVGMSVTFVADGESGASYRRAAELISAADNSLTFVDYWEPYDGYQSEDGVTDATATARSEYYAAIETAVRQHSGGDNLFHRRVVQVPRDRLGAPIPFDVDPPFEEYLRVVAELQQQSPRSCRLRIAPAQIRFHYIMIDQRYVLMPILSTDSVTRKQSRLGALVFDDRTGTLVRTLRGMYQDLEARSHALDPERLSSRVADGTATQT